MDRIVKYDNYMNSLSFANFTQVDMNFFITLCSFMKNQGVNKISFSFNELREITHYTKSNSIQQFASDLMKMNEKLMKVTCKLETKSEILMFVLFPTFSINLEKQILTVCVNQDFKFILNEITKNFTRFDLQEFITLDRKYSKTLYRLLKQYRSTGHYEVSSEELKKLLDYPDTYKNKYVMDKIIKPSLKELDEYFQNLKCEPQYAHKRGRPVTGYIFTFTPENRKRETDQNQMQKEKSFPGKNKNSANGFANFHQRTYDYDQLEKELISQSMSDQLDESQLKKILEEMKK